jgi:hypothetical protein
MVFVSNKSDRNQSVQPSWSSCVQSSRSRFPTNPIAINRFNDPIYDHILERQKFPTNPIAINRFNHLSVLYPKLDESL